MFKNYNYTHTQKHLDMDVVQTLENMYIDNRIEETSVRVFNVDNK